MQYVNYSLEVVVVSSLFFLFLSGIKHLSGRMVLKLPRNSINARRKKSSLMMLHVLEV